MHGSIWWIFAVTRLTEVIFARSAGVMGPVSLEAFLRTSFSRPGWSVKSMVAGCGLQSAALLQAKVGAGGALATEDASADIAADAAAFADAAGAASASWSSYLCLSQPRCAPIGPRPRIRVRKMVRVFIAGRDYQLGASPVHLALGLGDPAAVACRLGRAPHGGRKGGGGAGQGGGVDLVEGVVRRVVQVEIARAVLTELEHGDTQLQQGGDVGARAALLVVPLDAQGREGACERDETVVGGRVAPPLDGGHRVAAEG